MLEPNITEYHTLRVFVTIKNIHLLVRFPCRLSFQLKTCINLLLFIKRPIQ